MNDAPPPFGEWARRRLRELCFDELRRDASPQVKERLRTRYRDEVGCLRLIEAAR